jgi:uncharacterized membrane protein YeaQ/YmgE (transglycosylase-associated protein family)
VARKSRGRVGSGVAQQLLSHSEANRALVAPRFAGGLLMNGDASDFLWFILIGLIAGWLAGVLVKGGGLGIIGDIVVGILGALLGGWLFRQMGVSTGGGLGWSILVATVGAVVLIVVLRLVKRAP